jgi:hypothetical protein
MAINNEDKGDIKKHLGKALANKVAKVTEDSRMKTYIDRKYDIQDRAIMAEHKAKKDKENNRTRKVPVESKTIGTHYSSITSKRGKGHLKMNKTPHWGVEDFKLNSRQRERKQDR